MKEQTTIYWELYIKQKDDTISTDERAELETWILNNHDSFHEYEKIYRKSAVDEHSPSFDPNDQWKELQTMIKIDADSLAAKTIRLFPWIARVAAAVILVLGFTYLFYQYQDFSSNDLNLQTMVQTNDSDQKIIQLPDGTTVWLNRNSELLYPEIFDGETRILYLKGEAFFEVTPDKNKPFIVHSGISKTTVLGTSFNLRAYSGEDEVRLTVATGKVAFTLADDKEGVIVAPGNLAVLSNTTKSITHGQNTDANFLSWKTNHLTFNDNPIAELIKPLERHYGIEINVQNPATLNCRFTGDFQETDIENAIKIITRATGTTYELIEGQYIILGAGCN
ncbi:MAG: FecR domain-containing protein [Cyclobacteriaceae bacterium]|nr:FecR domain-containing protein [Cyclobacteriaceae bacterium]